MFILFTGDGMEQNNKPAYPKLCAGVFATILLSHRGDRIPKTKYFNQIKDAKSNIPALVSLICVVDPDYVNHKPSFTSIKKYTSQFLNCREKIPNGLRIGGSEYIALMNGQMQGNYHRLLWRMHSFLDEIIGLYDDDGNEKTLELSQLVRETIEIIRHDNKHKESKFPIGENGELQTISEALKTGICFQSFVLGVWAYIIDNAIENAVKESLMENWKSDAKKGRSVADDINLTIQDIQKPENEMKVLCPEEASDVVEDDADEVTEEEIMFNSRSDNNADTEKNASDNSFGSSHNDADSATGNSQTNNSNGAPQLIQNFNNYGGGPQIAVNNGTIILGNNR